MAVSSSSLHKECGIFLFCGLLCASILINIDQPLMGIFYVFDPLLTQALANGDSIKVIFFSVLIAIGVEVMRQSGGTKALVAFFLRFTKTRRASMVTMWFAGLTVFFDDYANCLIVGSSMRSVADKARISRAKLAYLVDSTAAPVATLALISTWIGYEVSLMDKAMNTVEQIPMGFNTTKIMCIFAMPKMSEDSKHCDQWRGVSSHQNRARTRVYPKAIPPSGPFPFKILSTKHHRSKESIHKSSHRCSKERKILCYAQKSTRTNSDQNIPKAITRSNLT